MSETKPVKYINTPISVKFDYTPGQATSLFLRSVKKGQLIGSVCPDTGKVYCPPRLYSVETASPMTEIVDVSDTGCIYTFCIVNIKFYDQAQEVPYVSAYILLDGSDLPIMHMISGIDINEIRAGMRVKAVWRDKSEWIESMENIKYFEPTGEPDAPIGEIMENIRSKSHA